MPEPVRPVQQASLCFGGMNVNIDSRFVNINKNSRHRKEPRIKSVAVAGTHSMHQRDIINGTTIDNQMYLVAIAAAYFGTGYETGNDKPIFS